MDQTQDNTVVTEKSFFPTLGLVVGIAATLTGIANIPFPAMMLGGAAAAAGIMAIAFSYPFRYRPGIGLGVAAILFAGVGFLITPRSLAIDDPGRRTFYSLPGQGNVSDVADLRNKLEDLEHDIFDLRQQMKQVRQEWGDVKRQGTPDVASVPALPQSVPPAQKISGVPERLLDTGTILMNGQTISLFGIVPITDPHHVALLTNFIAAHGRKLECDPQGVHYICKTASHYDVATVALSNGGARVAADATSEYRHFEEEARQKRLGIWH